MRLAFRNFVTDCAQLFMSGYLYKQFLNLDNSHLICDIFLIWPETTVLFRTHWFREISNPSNKRETFFGALLPL